MDHEISSSQLSGGQVGWDWLSVQFTDGRELMLYQLRLADGRADPDAYAASIDDRTALVVVSAPCYPFGVIDPVADIAGIAAGVGALGLNTDFVPALPVGLMKTLSGSGARGLMVDVMKTYGVDSFQGKLAAIIQGSTETTFYVLAVYFGSVNIRQTRQALACGLFADAVGLVGAILVGYLFYR